MHGLAVHIGNSVRAFGELEIPRVPHFPSPLTSLRNQTDLISPFALPLNQVVHLVHLYEVSRVLCVVLLWLWLDKPGSLR